jgi:hypothetical protein
MDDDFRPLTDAEYEGVFPREPKSNQPAYTLTNLEMLEVLFFIYTTGYISRERHDAIEDLKFELETVLDNLEPGWSPSQIENIVKKYRKEHEDGTSAISSHGNRSR